jgi:hypothetical protein
MLHGRLLPAAFVTQLTKNYESLQRKVEEAQCHGCHCYIYLCEGQVGASLHLYMYMWMEDFTHAFWMWVSLFNAGCQFQS